MFGSEHALFELEDGPMFRLGFFVPALVMQRVGQVHAAAERFGVFGAEFGGVDGKHLPQHTLRFGVSAQHVQRVGHRAMDGGPFESIAVRARESGSFGEMGECF